MYSDEDFSLVTEDMSSETTLEGVKRAIAKCKAQHDQLLVEQEAIRKATDGQRDLTEQFQRRSKKLIKDIEDDRCSQAKDVKYQKEKQKALQQQESTLKSMLLMTEADLSDLTESADSLSLLDEPSALPEKKVVFTGTTGAVTGGYFETKPRITYPMEGGTALITFEEAIVAQNILRLKEHKVELGEDCICTITLEAKPVQFIMPSIIEMDAKVCPQRILVSNLPKKDHETLLDKLELHFSKKRNGGGDVEERDMLHDSGNVVITFSDTVVDVKGLTDKIYHDVEFGGKKCRVKVTPFQNGKIKDVQTKTSVCKRTVLLTGIPNIMEQEDLQDLLEIHFQKSSNGGGDVDHCLYNPLGQQTLAVFEEDCPAES